VYCRPSCASRQPRPANVRFFDTPGEAEQMGFRACKRCNPRATGAHNPHTDAIVHACSMIETADTPPTLAELAQAVGLSPFHFQRLFKATVGITPKQYAITHRLQRMQGRLQQDATVTEAVYNAGFVSSSRFYEASQEALGMKPSTYRGGAEGQQINVAVAQSSLGWVLVAATGNGICAITFGDDPTQMVAELRGRFPRAEIRENDPDFAGWVSQVVGFIETPEQGLDLPLDIQGTAFQRRVWAALREIAPGTTASYGEIASRIGNPKASRAVAQACGSNKIAVAIPCHRVVGSNDDLGGYHWGIERKQALLEREAAG
jgi:AraC family transcriptional regulator of adaptative response/methylated-DNA-[protein]-cysteine methyltransferase